MVTFVISFTFVLFILQHQKEQIRKRQVDRNKLWSVNCKNCKQWCWQKDENYTRSWINICGMHWFILKAWQNPGSQHILLQASLHMSTSPVHTHFLPAARCRAHPIAYYIQFLKLLLGLYVFNTTFWPAFTALCYFYYQNYIKIQRMCMCYVLATNSEHQNVQRLPSASPTNNMFCSLHLGSQSSIPPIRGLQ